MSKSNILFIALNALIIATLACGSIPQPEAATDTTAPIAPTDAPITLTDTPMAPTDTPITPTDTPGEPCTLHTEKAVTVYTRPSHDARIFFEFEPGAQQPVHGTTADGWLGFSPGIPQAANVGPFRLRWVDPNDGISITGDCSGVTEMWGPPPGICFLMVQLDAWVYPTTDPSSPLVVTLLSGEFAAILGRTADGEWAQVDLGPGNTGLTDVGWIRKGDLNMNGATCSSLPTVSP